MLKRFFSLLAVGALVCVPAVTSAQIIYDAPPDDGNGLVNQAFPDFPEFSSYLVADVTLASDTTVGVIDLYCFEAAGVTINWEGNVTSGVLNIFPKTGALPDNSVDPGVGGNGIVVPIDLTLVTETGGDGTGQYLMTACGINMPLTAGDYWIGFAPDAEFGIYSQVFMFGSLVIQGEQAAFRNPGGGFALGTDWADAGTLLLGFPWELAMQIREPENCGGGGGFCPPTAFSTFRGLPVGTPVLADFVDSDNVYAMYNPGFVLNSEEAPVWLVFNANCPTAIDVLVESNAGTPGLTYTVEAWDYVADPPAYTVIGTQGESFNVDAVTTFPLTSANQIDGNGDVQSRIGWRKTGLTINFPWQVNIDQIGWNQ